MKKRRHVKALLRDFLAHRLSAAGVSYVVTSRTVFRRVIWLAVLSITFIGMTYMTYQVVQEYLAYPTVMMMKSVTVRTLDFPAVTICGHNKIPKMNAKNAELEYIEDMVQMLYNLPTYNLPKEEKQRCRQDPMCIWLWTRESCSCAVSPCDTALCVPKSSSTCTCSMLMCKSNSPEMYEACDLVASEDNTRMRLSDDQGKECLCKKNFKYPLATPDMLPLPCTDESEGDPSDVLRNKSENCHFMEYLEADFVNALKAATSDFKIQSLLAKIKQSRVDDLKDIESFFKPYLRTMDDYGHSYSDLVLSCNYGPLHCDRKNFTTLYSPTFGKCYIFNFVGEDRNKTPLSSKHAGRSSGLQLYLRSRKKDTIDLLARQLGVRVVIHDPRDLPYASEHGMDLRPGDMATFGIEYESVHRLGKPYGDCLQDGASLPFNYSRQLYSQLACERMCMNSLVLKYCGCEHTLFITGNTKPQDDFNLCDPVGNPDQGVCFDRILLIREKGEISCPCPPACKEPRYYTSKSTGEVNPAFFRLVKTAKSLTMKNGNPSVAYHGNVNDTIGLRVYYRSLSVRNITQVTTYSWQSLVANIGGNIGLFLGLSLVTFLEVMEFFVDLFCYVLCRQSPKRVFRKVSKVHSGYK